MGVPKEIQTVVDQAVDNATRPWREMTDRARQAVQEAKQTVRSLRIAIIVLLGMQLLTIGGLVAVLTLLLT